jgi:NADH-quinone oxidoreductase subunit K
MVTLPLSAGLILAPVLFAIGLVGLLVRRNIIFMLLSIEIMLHAAGLAFVAVGAHLGAPDGQIMYLFILAMTAAEVSVGLALILRMVHGLRSLDTDRANEMRG